MGVVVLRRYIDILTIIINFTYSTLVLALFLAAVYHRVGSHRVGRLYK